MCGKCKEITRNFIIFVVFLVYLNILTKLAWQMSYREKNHRDSQSDGHQHSQAHTENQDIQGARSNVGV